MLKWRLSMFNTQGDMGIDSADEIFLGFRQCLSLGSKVHIDALRDPHRRIPIMLRKEDDVDLVSGFHSHQYHELGLEHCQCVTLA